MPRNESMEGWGQRVKRVRLRLKLSIAAWAAACGVTPGSANVWETRDSGTSASTIKRGLRSESVWDLDRTLSWLADGEGREPRWLEDESLDPRQAPEEEPAPDGHPPRPGLAMPQALIEKVREAHAGAEELRVAGELRSAPAIKTWTALDGAIRLLPPLEEGGSRPARRWGPQGKAA